MHHSPTAYHVLRVLKIIHMFRPRILCIMYLPDVMGLYLQSLKVLTNVLHCTSSKDQDQEIVASEYSSSFGKESYSLVQTYLFALAISIIRGFVFDVHGFPQHLQSEGCVSH